MIIELAKKSLIKCDECGKEYLIHKQYIKRGRNKYNKDLCRSCKTSWLFAHGERTSKIGEYNKRQKGKTLEERLGKIVADKIKKNLSECNGGENNPNFGGKYSNWSHTHKKRIGKTWEDLYGTDRAAAMKEIASKNSSGSNNPMYGKPSPVGSGNGWSGWYKSFYFRSLLELSYLKYLIDNNIKFEIAEIKKYAIQYFNTIKNKEANYFPDFYLIDTQEIIEIKPKKLLGTQQNKDKYKAAKKKLKKKFIILTEENITKLSDDEIKELYDNGSLKFIKRYEEKYKRNKT